MRAIVPAACLTLLACGPPPARIADGFYFDPDWVAEIHIELDEQDFEELRVQHREWDDVFCATEPPPNPYTYFEADITIDGIEVGSVGVRKKGFFGSVVEDRPSFKVSFNHYVRGQRFFGMRRMTLQNAVSDPARIKQCLGYELFAAAGVPASRCSFAHVTVNHEDLGLYTNLESIKTELLDRYFDDTTGNLYEGALSDFQPDWIGTFQRKTNLANPDRSDLDRVMDAAEAPDDDLVESLQRVIALDEFYDFWAMEVIIAHWDGYASFNHNNYYIYNNPRTGRFHFFPWGIDGILFEQPGATYSVFADSVLAHRLYKYEPTRDIYLDRVRTHLGDWDEGQILTRIDEMETLVEPLGDPYGDGRLGDHIDGVRHFVRTYPTAILDEIDAGPEEWDKELNSPPCWATVGAVTAELDTTWGTMGAPDPFTTGAGSWQVAWFPEEGDTIIEVGSQVGAIAGLNRDVAPGDPFKPTIALVAIVPGPNNDTIAYALAEFPDAAMITPGTIPVGFAGEGAFGVLFTFDPELEGSTRFFLLKGELILEEAETAQGAAIIGSLSADIRETGW